MTDTAPAASAAPVVPAAPVVAAPAAAPVAPVAPAAPAAPVAPAAPAPAIDTGASMLDSAPAVPAAPAATAGLVPGTPEFLAAAKAAVAAEAEAAKLAAQPNSGLAWNLNDTTPGTGEKPAWFKSDKYVSVAKQAEAYVALEQRFGAFTGAPKNEKGEVAYKTPPEVINANDPMLQSFSKLAGELQLSQDGYNKVLGMMAQREASQIVPISKAIEALGPEANTRISNVVTWAKANLDDAGFQLMRAATSDGKTAAATFAVLERIVAKTGQMRMPKPGEDTAAASAQGLEAINAMQAAKNAKGQRLYEIDPAYRVKVEQARTEYFKTNPVQRDRQGNRRG